MNQIEIIEIESKEHAKQLARQEGCIVNKHAAEYYGELVKLKFPELTIDKSE